MNQKTNVWGTESMLRNSLKVKRFPQPEAIFHRMFKTPFLALSHIKHHGNIQIYDIGPILRERREICIIKLEQGTKDNASGRNLRRRMTRIGRGHFLQFRFKRTRDRVFTL